MTQEKYVGFFYLKIFSIFVILLIILSIIYRVYSEVASSKFINNSFSILYVAKDSKLIYVDKNSKEALFLAIGDMRKIVKGKNYLGVAFSLGLPINALIMDESPPSNLSEFSSSNSEWRLLSSGNVSLKNMNRYDIHKIVSAIRNTPKDNRVEKRVNIFDREVLKELDERFVDSSIVNMPYTIEIENGTVIDGLGSQLAHILGKEGFNVIAVRTSRPASSSFIAFPQKNNSYTSSLIGLTGFEYREERVSQAADVTIFLGDDLEAMLVP